MSTFQERVQAYTGSISDTAALTDWLTSGARFIVDLLPDHVLEEYTTTQSVTTNGFALSSYRVQQVLKNGYEARRVPSGMSASVQDENSLHYALSNSPVSLVYNGKLYIYPNGGEVLAMLYPTVTYNASTLSGFPAKMLHGVVLFAAIQGMLSKSSDALESVSAVSLPTAPDDPAIVFADVTTSAISLPSVPTYTKPTTTFSATNLSSYVNSTTTEDLDQAQAEATHQKLLLEQYQMDLYNELNEYNKELEIYKVQMQKAIEDARKDFDSGVITKTKDLEALIADYQSQISKYQSQIQAYTNQISANVNLTQGYLLMVDKLKAELKDFISGVIGSNG